jgi:hypothetical protein
MTRDEKVAFLTEHLRYEVLMLRYCLKRLVGEEKQLEYNMAYEAFAVHARLLDEFLTSKGGNRNVNSKDFVNFTASGRNAVDKKFDKLNAQVFHFGNVRLKGDEKKVTLPQAQDVAKWIENEIERFLKSLDQDLQDAWKPDDADPDKVEPEVLTIGPKGPAGPPLQVRNYTGPSATNVGSSTSSKPTTSSATTADHFTALRKPPKVID